MARFNVQKLVVFLYTTGKNDMSDFYITTISDASKLMHIEESELLEKIEASNMMCKEWRWGDGVKRLSMKTSDMGKIDYDKKPIIFSNAFDLELPPVVSYDFKNETIDLHVYSGDVYWFEASRCKTNKQLLGWISHLSGKCWFCGSLCRELIEVASKHSDLITINHGC